MNSPQNATAGEAAASNGLGGRYASSRTVRRAAPALGVGLLLAFSSSFGQTYFLSIFGGVWREAFDLSHGAFGALYAAATLLSAASLLVLGKVVDHAPASRIAMALLGLTALAALWMSSAASVFALAVGLFAMRVLGQGLLSHLAMTTTAKWFDSARGRALGVAMLGFPIGEAMLPIIAVAVTVAFGWRATWIGVAAIASLALAPAVFLLAQRAEATMAPAVDREDSAAREETPASWRRRDALRDWRFYALAPGLLATPFMITSVLFHQAHLVDVKGWTLSAFAALFPLYAAFSTAAGLLCGRIVDAVGTPRVLPFFLLPLAAGLLCVSRSDVYGAGAFFMASMGTTAGAATIVYTSVWSEMYGSAHLGAIRAVAVSAMVFSSAVGPALVGGALDAGLSLNTQMAAMSAAAAICAASLALLQSRLRWRPPQFVRNQMAGHDTQ